MVLPSSGAISVNDFATEYEIGTGSPIGFDRIKTISTNWSGTSMGMDQLYSLDRDDLVGNSTPTKSVAGLGTFSSFATRYTMSFRVAVGLSATTDGNIVNTGNTNSEGVAIYTWAGKLYARAGDGNISNSGDGEVSFTIPSDWTTDQIRIVVVTFCLNTSRNNEELGTNLLFVDGILRNQSTVTRFEKVTSSIEGGKTGVVNTAGYGVKTRMSNNDLSYETPSAIISAQVWYDRIGYVPSYNTGTVKGNYFIYENSNVYIVFTAQSTNTLGLYDIGPNTRPDVRYLVVAGGGGGGSQGAGGGGGGGGILFDNTGVALAAGTYTVTIGVGGGGGKPGDNGDNTTFHTYTALGGGGGGRVKNATTYDPGQNGGTGGGGAANVDSSFTSVGGTGSQGGDGGDGSIYSGVNYGGGGGGGGAGGQDGMDGERLAKPVRPWGSGGNGTQYSWGHLGETATYYGGGGAGEGSDATERSLGGGGFGAGSGDDREGLDIYGGGGYSSNNGGSGSAMFRLPWTLPTS